MAEIEKKRIKTRSPLEGAQTKPTVLDSTTKLDIDLDKKIVDNIIDAGLVGGLDVGSIENFTSLSNSRSQLYQLLDTMGQDSAVSSIIRTYAADACDPADSGHIMWCEADDPKISKFVNYLLNVMNVDKNIYKWAYCLIKYGDVYLRLFRESDYKDPVFDANKINDVYTTHSRLNESLEKPLLDENVNLSIHTTSDPYSYYVEMVPDPSTMFELTKYGKTYGYIEVPNANLGLNFYDESFAGGTNMLINNYRMKTMDINIYQADDFVHACLDDNFNRYPEQVELFNSDTDYNADINAYTYSVKRGKSMLADSYKVWREKALLENAILLSRVTRSSILRKVQVECGDMPKEQVKQTLRRVKDLMEQKSAINTAAGQNGTGSFTEYTNPGPMENNIYFATHNGQGAITVESIGGEVNVKDLADYDGWVNKFYAAYGIPKAFFGYTDDGAGFNGGQSLSIISSVYAKGVKHVQNALIQAITDAINLILINRGCKAYLNNFIIKMKAPLTQEEKDFREDLSNRVTGVSNINSLFGDVESRSRKLEILKELIATLNYGDGLSAILQKEIDAAKEAEEKAKEEAEAENNANTEAEPAAESDEGGSLEAIDLGNSNEIPTEESFKVAENTMPLVEGPDFLIAEDELINPADIEDDIDFSKNN